MEVEPELANEFRVESIPVLVFFAEGRPVSRAVGLVNESGPHQVLTQLIDAAIQHAS